jgi:pilus assembly protein CpaE
VADKRTGPESKVFLAFVSDPESEKVLASLPYGEYDLQPVIMRGDAEAAYQYLQQNRSPRILLVDLSKSQLPVSDVSKLAEVCEPGVEVITIGQSNDVAVFRGLIGLGVRDYIVKPLSEGLVIRNINMIISGSETQKTTNFMNSGNLVTFLGARGGVGTSSLVANCAWLLSETFHKRVHLIDMNFYAGSLCYFFDLAPTHGLIELLSTTDPVDVSVVDKAFVNYAERLTVTTAQLGFQEEFSPNIQTLKQTFDILCQQSHYAMIDFPRNYDPDLMKYVLGESHVVVIVCDLTFFSVRDTVRYIELARSVAHSQQRIMVVANRVGEYKKGEFALKTFEDVIHHSVDALVSFDSVAPLEALNKGVVAASTGGGLFAKGVTTFAQALVGREAPKKKKGLFW